uniref:Uncharacterized protein n=1 Tax=Chenopodium quinoa TaxID=63459 RepID=A0A803MX95_CHEQI
MIFFVKESERGRERKGEEREKEEEREREKKEKEPSATTVDPPQLRRRDSLVADCVDDDNSKRNDEVLEDRDPSYEAMLNKMVGKISSKPGGKLEMGEANVVQKPKRPLPKVRNTTPETGRYEERPVAAGTLNVAQFRHIMRLHQGKADEHDGPLGLKEVAERFQVDAVQLEKILQEEGTEGVPPEEETTEVVAPAEEEGGSAPGAPNTPSDGILESEEGDGEEAISVSGSDEDDEAVYERDGEETTSRSSFGESSSGSLSPVEDSEAEERKKWNNEGDPFRIHVMERRGLPDSLPSCSNGSRMTRSQAQPNLERCLLFRRLPSFRLGKAV